jgi:hypothetical protein
MLCVALTPRARRSRPFEVANMLFNGDDEKHSYLSDG